MTKLAGVQCAPVSEGVPITSAVVIMFAIVAEHDTLRSKNWKNKLNKFIETMPAKMKNLSEPVTLIQAHMRAYIARKKYKQLRKAGLYPHSVQFLGKDRADSSVKSIGLSWSSLN